MRKLLLAASAAALMAACSGAAQAQGADQGRHGHGGMMFQADSNQDGTLTRAEFDAGRSAMFARMDTNSDGTATREEMRASFREHRGERREGRREHHWESRDADNNGVISREEFVAGPAQQFDRLDANHDGQLSADERPQRRERGEGGDHHGGRHGGRGGFMGADANNDGSITRAEFDAGGLAMFQRMDANNDGQVTRAEAEAAHPQRRAPS